LIYLYLSWYYTIVGLFLIFDMTEFNALILSMMRLRCVHEFLIKANERSLQRKR